MKNRRSLWSQVQMVLLPGWGGRTHSVQEVRRARDVLRVGAVFAATILVPALLLSYLSLSSIRSEELFVDAEYRTQADEMTAEIDEDVQTIFERFEFAARSRIERSESPLARLADLSPYLRGAYRFDSNGKLAAPFDDSTRQSRPEPTAEFESDMLQAHVLERDEQFRAAASQYAAAAKVTSIPAYKAEALFGEARALGSAGASRLESDRLTRIFADFATVRGRHGFRFGDLAGLVRAQRQFDLEPSASGTTAMEQLVIRLLTQQWTIGQPGEATIARNALGQLAGVADPDWIARRRTELNERVAQLTWTEQIEDELELVSSARPVGDELALIGANMDSDAVWAILAVPDGRYAFAFSQRRMARDLYAAIQRINERQDLLTVQLLTIRDPLPDGQVTVSPLRPPLSTLRLAIAPRDQVQLDQLKERRRRTRLAVVFVSVFMVLVGVFFSARTIGHEMESARMKADFAANVSHELRSPITQIRLKGEALQLGLVDEGDDTTQHYDAIVREAERLSRLVDNVLDFAAIERGAKRYQLRIEDLLTVVWTTVEANRHAVESKGLVLELDLPDDTPPVWMDREAIGQVLVNLLSNAAKYGKKGGWVGVNVRTEPQGVTLSVSDRGQGIRPDDLPHIFEHFYRSTSSSVRRQKGTGIGLAIVRYIVEAHGGTITVHSVHGEGTTFTVTFPNEPPPGAGAAT